SFFLQAEDGIRDRTVTGVQTCALPICRFSAQALGWNLQAGLERKNDRPGEPLAGFHARRIGYRPEAELEGDECPGCDLLRGPDKIGRASCRETGSRSRGERG